MSYGRNSSVNITQIAGNTIANTNTTLPENVAQWGGANVSAAVGHADGLYGGANTLPPLMAFGMTFNGSSWDRARGNTDNITLLASAARTAAIASADQTNYNARGVLVVLNVTVASGTGGLSVQVRGKDPVSGNYYQLNAAPTAVTATGTFVYMVYPGVSGPGAGVTQVASAPLPRTWDVNVSAGDSSSYTYSVAASLIL